MKMAENMKVIGSTENETASELKLLKTEINLQGLSIKENQEDLEYIIGKMEVLILEISKEGEKRVLGIGNLKMKAMQGNGEWGELTAMGFLSFLMEMNMKENGVCFKSMVEDYLFQVIVHTLAGLQEA